MAKTKFRLSLVTGMRPGKEKPYLEHTQFGEVVEFERNEGGTFLIGEIPASVLNPTLAASALRIQAKRDPERANSGHVRVSFYAVEESGNRASTRSASSIPDAAIADNDDEIPF